MAKITSTIKPRVEKLLAALDQPIGYGYSRWQDEKKYEDIADYAVLYEAEAKKLGWEITKMTPSPYGFRAVHRKAKVELEVSVRASELTWKARPLGGA